MRPSFHPRLINDPFFDPGLFIPFQFEKRALLFDLGDLRNLSPRDLLKVSHVFVTHAHMDHFIGFDTLLRVFLGRERELHLFGPEDFLKRVEGRLAGYTWNLVDDFPCCLQLKATEVRPARLLTRTYASRDRFRASDAGMEAPFSGVILREPSFHVEACILDHRIPSLGLSLVENRHVNIIKEGLKELGLPVGPWLTRFKRAVYEKWDPEREFFVTWEQGGILLKQKGFPFGGLSEKIARISPGRKITYVADALGSPENRRKILSLAGNADHLFIEAAFLDRDRERAGRRRHLTAKEAGELAKGAEVKQFTPFHFSPRYSHCPEDLYREAMASFNGDFPSKECPGPTGPLPWPRG